MGLKVNKETAPSTEMKDDATAVEQVGQDAGKTGTQTATMQTNTEVQGHDGNGEGGDDGDGEGDDAAGDQGQGEYVGNGDDAGAGDGDDAVGEQHDGELVEGEAGQSAQQTTSKSTEVALQNGTAAALPTVVVGAAHNVFKQMIDELAAEGQVGLEMGYGVFPTLALDKGEFKIGDEDLTDEEFKGVPLFSQPKYAYRTTGLSNEKENEVIFSTSNQDHLDTNSAVAAKLLEWKQKWPHSNWEIKTYQDVYWFMTDLPSKPDRNGQLLILSVSPTSIRRYTQACLFAKQKGYAPHECVFTAKVGEKIRGDNDYYPWEFKVDGSCKKLGVEVKFGGERDEDF